MERSKRSDDRNASALPRTHHRYCRGNGEGGAFEIGSQQLGHLLHRLWRKFSIPREHAGVHDQQIHWVLGVERSEPAREPSPVLDIERRDDHVSSLVATTSSYGLQAMPMPADEPKRSTGVRIQPS